MAKYYKIVSMVCPFTERYKIQNIGGIAPGTVFSVQSGGLNFSDCAFDAMLWFDILNDIHWDLVVPERWQPTYIYEITPKTAIIKERCCDDYGVFECSAAIIEFGNHVPVEQVARAALEEYNRTKIAKYFKYVIYNRQFIKRNINLWQEKYL